MPTGARPTRPGRTPPTAPTKSWRRPTATAGSRRFVTPTAPGTTTKGTSSAAGTRPRRIPSSAGTRPRTPPATPGTASSGLCPATPITTAGRAKEDTLKDERDSPSGTTATAELETETKQHDEVSHEERRHTTAGLGTYERISSVAGSTSGFGMAPGLGAATPNVRTV